MLVALLVLVLVLVQGQGQGQQGQPFVHLRQIFRSVFEQIAPELSRKNFAGKQRQHPDSVENKQ